LWFTACAFGRKKSMNGDEKVALLSIAREDDWMYYVKDGGVWKVQRAGRGVPKGRPSLVADGGFQMDSDFIYFLDQDGDVARTKRAALSHRTTRPRRKPVSESSLKTAPGHDDVAESDPEGGTKEANDDDPATGTHDGLHRITHALQIMKEPIDKILAGTKTWEIRGTTTSRRGPIGLIQSKTGHIVGTCEVVDVIGPLSLDDLQRNEARTGSRPDQLYYQKTYAWVLRNAHRLAVPIPFRHPHGAVIWIKLEPAAVASLNGALAQG
jgi:hypothetical protein